MKLHQLLNEYLNPVYYLTILFDKNEKPEIKRHETKIDAYTWASEMPGIGAVIIAKNRDKNTTRISRADFNVDVPKTKQTELKKTALDLGTNSKLGPDYR